MNALVCMQAKKRRLHAVPSCGSDRLKLHFREGSVADISLVTRGPFFFSGSLSFFSANWAQNLRDPDAGRLGRCQQLTPPENGVLGDHFHTSEQHVIFAFLLAYIQARSLKKP